MMFDRFMGWFSGIQVGAPPPVVQPAVPAPVDAIVEHTQDIAFLACVSACEGTAGPNGYRTQFGGTLVDIPATGHPNVRVPFKNTKGETQYSTAFGKYQINLPTYADFAPRLGVTDMSPASQDRIANAIIDTCGARQAIRAGRLQAALDNCAGRWASLPASKYPQPKRSYAFAAMAFKAAGGVITEG